MHCFQFLLRLTIAPREIENNNYAQFWRDNQQYHGIFEKKPIYPFKSSFLRVKSFKEVVLYTAISHDRVVIDYNHNYGAKKQLLNPVLMIFKVNEVSRVFQILG